MLKMLKIKTKKKKNNKKKKNKLESTKLIYQIHNMSYKTKITT